MSTRVDMDNKSKDDQNISQTSSSEVLENGINTFVKSEVLKAIVTKTPPQDPPAPSYSTSSPPPPLLPQALDYFTTNFTTLEQQEETSQYSSHQIPAKSIASVAGSDAQAPGTILSPDIQLLAERPTAQRHISSATVLSMQSVDSNDTITQADKEVTGLSASQTLPPRPAYPNQAYAALQNQYHPTRNHPPTLRQRSSHPSHILTFSPSLHQSGVRTVGNSPAATPSAGLYSFKTTTTTNGREEWDTTESPGTYASPYLHPTHRQAPKETHVADVDVDPISGRKLINHYEIIDELGRGTHGKVKLGRDLEATDTYVAIKIVERYSKRRRLGKLGNPEDKVKKEVAILKKARHPSIVALLEVIDDPSRKKVYIVLEWVERGTIHWRAKAPKEIALLESHRYDRERSGEQSGASQAEDTAVQREVAKRLNRRKQEINRLYRRARKDRDPNRGIDHYGGNEESDEDTLSRISTATNESSIRAQKQDVPVEDVSTPTIERPELPIEVLTENVAITEDLRQWASKLVDAELHPDLQYVPCMTLQNIRVAFRDTLLGLQYLHYQGIIHRDIKPPNLLQTIDHRVKISDFGVSYLGRPVHEGDLEEVSESETKDFEGEAKELAKTVGTPAFYAPELCITDHLEDAPPITKAIDVWALGVTLFCMIFARTPFVDSEYVVMRQIADEDIYLPRQRLRPIDDKPKSRPNSRSRAYSPLTADRRGEFDISYEDIDDDLHDLLKRLLIKDPQKRITLEEVRHHPWIVADLPNKLKWLEETDASRQGQGQKIEVSKEDLNTAVVPLQWVERMRSGIKNIGHRLLGSTTRGRSTSSANSASAPNSQPPSAHSSSSTIDQDARRHSLRGDEIFSVLKAQKEAEHPLARSLAASPDHESANRAFFDDMPHLGPFNDFGASLVQTMSHDSAVRPPMLGRSRTDFSTTGSIRTIKASDVPTEIEPSSPGLPGTPRAIDSPAGNLSGLIGGSHRHVFRTVRERTSAQSLRSARQTSTDRATDTTATTTSSRDAHGEPSLAVSETVAAGRIQTPDILSIDTASSASNSEQNSPVSIRPHGITASSGHRAVLGALSRQSSTSSVTSSARQHSHDITPIRTQPPTIRNGSSEESWRRDEEQYMRRFLLEVNQNARPTNAFDERDCPPSPDDIRSRQSSDTRRISEFDISRPSSSYETSPTTQGDTILPSLVSSSSDFGSAVSISNSNPSAPSAISVASSIDRTDGLPLEEVENKHMTSRYLKVHRDDPADEGYNPDEDMALDSDEASDSDTDSDGGLVMSRRKSASKMALSSSPRNAFSSSLESQHKQRRGTGLSRSSKKSSRSGSNNTMKKVRTRDSIEDRRRTSCDTEERN